MTQWPLFVPRGAVEVPAAPRPPSVARDTSRDAAEAIRPRTAALRARVREAIVSAGARGQTCDECEIRLGLSHQTCSPRILELSRVGAVVDTGMRRLTRGHRQAIVWVAR